MLFPLATTAHHSHGEFSGDVTKITGEIESVVWRNPHPALTLRVTDSKDQQNIWRIQVLGNVNGLNRNGITGNRFQVGKILTLTGRLSIYRDGLILAEQASFPGGEVVELGPTGSLGAVSYSETNAAEKPQSTDQAPSIYRVWSVVSRTRNFDLPLKDDARLIKQAWNPVSDDQQRNCSPIGMPGAMMSPHPIEFLKQGDNILLRLEEWDAQRNIQMTAHHNTASLSPRSGLGTSVGIWEENTLQVRTDAISYPYMDEFGTPQSEAIKIVERFTLSPDGRFLDWEAQVTDANTFNEPFIMATARWQWIPGETLQSYDCQKTDDLLDPE